MRTVVIGGGIAGATAALRMAEAGRDVTLIESGATLGGLVVSFAVAGTPLECFYHHVFPHEREIQGLIDELGLTPQLDWLQSTVGVLVSGKLWPFTSARDLLTFGPLAPLHRVRMGVGALLLGRSKDWQSLDTISAREWLRKATGSAAVTAVWDPLLSAKFGPAAADVPAAWMWGRFQQRLGARKGDAERLGYLRGGFRQIFEALAVRLAELGVEVRVDTRVTGIDCVSTGVQAVETTSGRIETDTILYTGALPGLNRIVAGPLQDPRWDAPGLGVVCIVLETNRPLSSTYWTNVCDPQLPFGGVIEHTNMVPSTDYQGRHVTYLSRYYTPDEDIAKADVHQVAEEWLEALAERFPGFTRDCVTSVHPFRAPYAAPLVKLGHLQRMAPLQSHIPGLYVCTTAQIYPQDRGMSEGVRMGGEAAAAILAGGRAEADLRT